MSFFGSVSINFNTRNPYLTSEDYMDVIVTRDWDYEVDGSIDNIWLDIVDSISEFTIPELELYWTLELDFSLIKTDESGNYVDYAKVYFVFGSEGYAYGQVAGDYFFFEIPAIGTTVKVLLVDSHKEFSPMP